ncbi:MAG: hypothetical protein HFACDABA_01779 [Anaerolineales bacterium]|nr:hypothetical protein [Anaerolineales bacterium]
MSGSLDIQQLLIFPLKDNEARKNFLIAALVYLAASIVPVVPVVFILGYVARILRQTINGEELRMPAWEDWETLLQDGILLFGVRLVYTLPLMIVLAPVYILAAFTPVFAQSGNTGDGPALLPLFILGIASIVILPISLAVGLIVPAAEAHTALHSDFAAGFRVREWWAVFRSNWRGFLLALIIAMLSGVVVTSIVGLAMITLVLICALPLILPGLSAYTTLIMYAAFAQAYKDGKNRLGGPSHTGV